MGALLPIQQGITRNQVDSWVRPSDWPVIVDAINEVQFLVCDVESASFTLRTQYTRYFGSQDLVIDWGDGTSNIITATSETDTSKIYIPGTGTPCSRGYTTFKVRVYFTGTGESVLNNVQMLSGISMGGASVGLLEVYYGDNVQFPNFSTNIYSSYQSNSYSNYNYLEYAKLPSVITCTLINSFFKSCIALSKVVMWTSAPNLSQMNNMFDGCISLKEIVLPSDMPNLTNMTSCFTGCVSLKSITLPSYPKVTTYNGMFTSCLNLQKATISLGDSAVDMAAMFVYCRALEWIKILALPAPTISTYVNMQQMFFGCSGLETVFFPDTVSTNARLNFYQTFGSTTITRIKFPSTINIISLSSTFSNCLYLESIELPNMPELTDWNNAFAYCKNLKKITIPDIIGTSAHNFTTAFTNCTLLEEVNFPNGIQISYLTNTFVNCYSLKRVNWNLGIQNSLTSISYCFSYCVLLENVTLPTVMDALSSFGANNVFEFCYSLKEITFPSSLPNLQSLDSCFSSCRSLTSVTLPTSMPQGRSFNGTFSSCSLLKNIVLPFTISTSATTFQNTFYYCFNLERIEFPGADQYSSVNRLDSCFQNCVNLKTIINLNKIGSLTATPLLNVSFNNYCNNSQFTFNSPLSGVQFNGSGSSPIFQSRLQSLRLLNTSAGQWTGFSPQINVSYTNMSTADLVQLFTDMAAQPAVTSKTINITGAIGTSALTATDRQLITTKGWTITG